MKARTPGDAHQKIGSGGELHLKNRGETRLTLEGRQALCTDCMAHEPIRENDGRKQTL